MTKQLWQYRGRLRIGEKLKHIFAKGDDPTEFVADKSPFPRWAQPGSWFEFTFDDGGKYWLSGPNAPKFHHHEADKEKRTELEIKDRTEAAAHAAKKVHKEDKWLLERRLAPLRREYKRLWMSPESRAGLLAAMINEVTR